MAWDHDKVSSKKQHKGALVLLPPFQFVFRVYSLILQLSLLTNTMFYAIGLAGKDNVVLEFESPVEARINTVLLLSERGNGARWEWASFEQERKWG